MKVKKIKKSFLNAIDKIRALGYKEPDAPQERTNPYTGKKHTLDPLAVMMFDFITTRHHVCGIHYTRQTWDNARYCFCDLWPNEYMDLID